MGSGYLWSKFAAKVKEREEHGCSMVPLNKDGEQIAPEWQEPKNKDSTLAKLQLDLQTVQRVKYIPPKTKLNKKKRDSDDSDSEEETTKLFGHSQ